MPNLKISSRALTALDTVSHLFNLHGFQGVGVDRLIHETDMAKATFYNNFKSKEKLIEMCLIVQKDTLKEKITEINNSDCYATVVDKLKKIYLLHADLNGPYHLLFKAIFEIKILYPEAYQIVIQYRKWLVKQILALLLRLKSTVTVEDANMFLFIIDGSIVKLLALGEEESKNVLLDYFFVMI